MRSGLSDVVAPKIALDEIEIDIIHRQVRAGDSVIHLSGIEQSLLYLLASRSGRVVTRDEILDAIWGTDFVAESNIVDRHIRTLRSSSRMTIGTLDSSPLSSVGYRFIPTFTNEGWRSG